MVPYYTCLTTSLTNDMGLSLSLTQHDQSTKVESWRDEGSCKSGANPKKKVPEEKLTPTTKKSKLMTVLQDFYFFIFKIKIINIFIKNKK